MKCFFFLSFWQYSELIIVLLSDNKSFMWPFFTIENFKKISIFFYKKRKVKMNFFSRYDQLWFLQLLRVSVLTSFFFLISHTISIFFYELYFFCVFLHIYAYIHSNDLHNPQWFAFTGVRDLYRVYIYIYV